LLSKHGLDGAAWDRLSRSLAELIAEYNPELIAYEEVRQRQFPSAAKAYGAMVAFIQHAAFLAGRETLGCNVAEVKKFATGSGNADKDSMVKSALERWPGWRPMVDGDTNEADARWVAEFAAHKTGRRRSSSSRPGTSRRTT